MSIYVASDHRGIIVKESIIEYLNNKGISALDIGIPNKEVDDYPDYAFKLSSLVLKENDNLGILICGNGIGMSIAANKVKGIRCARVVNKEDAFNAKAHNGANVIAIGADISIEALKDIIDTFIETPIANEERHLNRINKIIKYEQGEYNEL